MKNLLSCLFSAFLIITIVSCSNSSKNDKKSDNQNVKDSTSEQKPMIKDRLLPENVNPEVAVKVSKLSESFFEWINTEVIIAGYVKMMGDIHEIGKEVQIIASPDSSTVLFNCVFKKEIKKDINAGDIIILKGKITENSYFGIKINDCEFISLNGKYIKAQSLNPYSLPTEPIFAADLYSAFMSWMGKEVTVTGNYNNTTTSTLNNNATTYRVDLEDPETGQNLVGCIMRDKPDSDWLSKNRKDIVIRGKVTKDEFGRVMLDDCVMVK
jgi:hypothetical protein